MSKVAKLGIISETVQKSQHHKYAGGG